MSVTAAVVAEPTELVNTASYSYPFCADEAVNEYVVDVAPLMAVHELPPLVELRHWTVGVGEPDAAALNDAVEPEATEMLEGWDVIFGALEDDPTVTVSVTAAVVAEPTELVNTASYLYPFCADEDVNEYVGEVAPLMAVHELPPLVELRHWTVGVGEPDAAARKDAVEPEATETLEGCDVTEGAVPPCLAWPAFATTGCCMSPMIRSVSMRRAEC